MPKFSLNKDKIKVLLLEGIHENARDYFIQSGYTQVEEFSKALDDKELIEKIKDTHIIGIRSRTELREHILKEATKLITIGCFSIGTNQVDLKCARMSGIPVFNAPYSNTRSVAELVIAECIMLMRDIPRKNMLAHQGKWHKSASDSYEVRGKKLGIIGYGHIGSQVSILAEALGMQVFFYDIVKKLALGNAKECQTLDELLEQSDILTMHVPSTSQTKNMFSDKQFEKMKKGSYFINAARGEVVDLKALVKYLSNKHIAGAAIDVFPKEPASNNEPFVNELQTFDNVILTPHIGGSTLEAQANIALEVAQKMVKYSDTGSTLGAKNFVNIDLRPNDGVQRFLHIHKNIPGVMQEINKVFSTKGINVAAQYLQTDSEVGYVIIDSESQVEQSFIDELRNINGTIKVRMLY
jgi:D-3-phosphoglycerate dehydrogenase / 2-oxoglutarate reductase